MMKTSSPSDAEMGPPSAAKLHELAGEVLRLDREATPGPWSVDPVSAVYVRHGERGEHGPTIRAGGGGDASLIATYRTAAPALARGALTLTSVVARFLAAHDARIAAGRARAKAEAALPGRSAPKRMPRSAKLLTDLPPEEQVRIAQHLEAEMAPVVAASQAEAIARAEFDAALEGLRAFAWPEARR